MQQTIHPAKGPIRASISLPGSKSITHRAILLAALADDVSELTGMHIDDDIRAFISALYQLGIVTQCDETTHSCIIAGGNGRFPKKQASVWCGKDATIARFLISAAAATPGVYYFDGTPALRARPIAQLLNILRTQGVQFIPSDIRKLPCTLIGTDAMEGGDIILESNLINQIISSLLMIAPYAKSPFNFVLPQTVTQPSIEMTCMMMAEFGVLVHRIHQGQYSVPVPQRYHAKDYFIEPDFALAIYFCGAAAITGGEIKLAAVQGVQSKQNASKFLSLLEKMGCGVFETNDGLTVKGPENLSGVEISLREFSDAFVVLAALAPFAKTKTRLTHVGNTMQRQELDRLIAMKTELIKLNIAVDSGKNWIEISPSTPLAGVIHSHQDHRIAMAFALIGLRIEGIVIDNVKQITRVFPEFFVYWKQLAETMLIPA